MEGCLKKLVLKAEAMGFGDPWKGGWEPMGASGRKTVPEGLDWKQSGVCSQPPGAKKLMTHTGDTREKKEAIEEFVAARGYRIAPHTIENSDFIFNVPYAQALETGDTALAERLRESYLDYNLAATKFAERISMEIFGREVAQTMLIHTNDITADCLDTMLTAWEERGYRFITLDEAMSDPAYATKDTLVTTFGPTWLWRWRKSMGKNISFRDDPEPPPWVVDLYRAIPPGEALAPAARNRGAGCIPSYPCPRL